MMDLGQIKLVFFVSFVSCALPTFVPSLQNQDFWFWWRLRHASSSGPLRTFFNSVRSKWTFEICAKVPRLCSGTILITKSVSVFPFYQPHFLRLLADSSLSESLGGFGSHNGLCCSGEGLKLGLSNSSILKSDCNNIQLSFGQFHSASFCFIAPFFHTCQGRAAVQRRYTGSYNLARVLMLVALQTFMSLLSRACFAKKTRLSYLGVSFDRTPECPVEKKLWWQRRSRTIDLSAVIFWE